jgi:hypothetical protein
VIGEGACASEPHEERSMWLTVPSSSYNFNAETLIYSNYEETMSFLLDFTFDPPKSNS